MPTDAEPVVIHCGDCLDVLRELPDGCVDAVVADPPYGINYDASESRQVGIKRFAQIEGDDETFDPSPFMDFPDVILWGCNHYCHAIPPKLGQWYFWDKVTKNSLEVRIAEGEFCWHKRGTKPRAFRHLWSGAYRASEANAQRFHPNQKPVALMRWCINLATRPGDLILDPFAGSGTTGVAAIAEGRKCILIEKEPKYVDICRRRIDEAMGMGKGSLLKTLEPSLLSEVS